MSYVAVICKLKNVRIHPNGDRLKIGIAQGNQVVTGLDSFEDQVGIYFADDGMLSEQYAEANDLIGRINPETGAHEGGFFSKQRRVRSQRFRGEKSSGYFAPLS